MSTNITYNVAKFEKVSKEQYILDGGAEEQYENILLPKRATSGSAGYDFFTPAELKIPPMSSIKIPTGIRCNINDYIVLKLYPRSGLGFKFRVSLNNTVGIIDSDYYYADNDGHIMVKLYNPNDYEIIIKENTAFCQGIFLQYFLADEDEVTSERTGGFGSTTNE